SEEHTSELQSLTNLVCRLLLEKKRPSEVTARVPCGRWARGKGVVVPVPLRGPGQGAGRRPPRHTSPLPPFHPNPLPRTAWQLAPDRPPRGRRSRLRRRRAGRRRVRAAQPGARPGRVMLAGHAAPIGIRRLFEPPPGARCFFFQQLVPPPPHPLYPSPPLYG